MRTRESLNAFALILLVALAGCGGGGSTTSGADAGHNSSPDVGNNCVPCGADCCGSGQTCDTATQTCKSGTCTPDCADKQCGNDGCGGQCAPGCNSGQTCANGQCCTTQCSGKSCGDDGCGGQCAPGCSADQTCVNGACQGSCTPACTNKQCGDDGCGGQCPPGCTGQNCVNGTCQGSCTPQCSGKTCGDDSCGGQCAPGCGSGETCTNGACQTGTTCNPPCTGSQVCMTGTSGNYCCNTPCGTSCCGSGMSCVNNACVYPAGTVTVSSNGNKLPPRWAVTDASVFKSDDTGAGAADHMNELVTLNVATTSSATPCPLPYTSSSGKVYCDGFNATDSGNNTVVVDTYDGFSKGQCPNMGTLPPSDGTQYSSIKGMWYDNYDSTKKVDTFVIMLTDCADLGGSGGYTGSKTPTASTDIATLLGGFTNGQQVSNIHGVVTYVWKSTTTASFGFTMQDPGGGPKSGVNVARGSTSTSTSTAPAVGDYVSVTGTVKKQGPISVVIHL